jgi:phosphoenolpyruvate carboxykinase (ATP)
MSLAHTRAIVRAILRGELAESSCRRDPVFGFEVPEQCPGVPQEVLNPRGTWKDASAYDAQANKLASMFAKNFAQFAGDVSPEVRAAGPVANQ